MGYLMNENNDANGGKNKPLYISSNVLERKDIVEGFGGTEIGIIGAALGIISIFFFVILISTGNVIFPFLMSVFLLTATIMIIRKDQFNENIIDKIRFVVLFSKTQKRYQFHYTDCLYGEMEQKSNGEEI